MTKTLSTRERDRCEWCGRAFVRAAGPGRPRRYCRQSCRQRDYEARSRAAELGLNEGELVIARDQLEALKDRLYVLACAVDDVERDLAADAEDPEVKDHAFGWLLEAARAAVRL